jgi:hypothetical protein
MRAVKGAAAALLESSVDNKDEVAVVSFRGARAEIVLQPCRDAAAADERKLLKCENDPENASIHRDEGLVILLPLGQGARTCRKTLHAIPAMQGLSGDLVA